MIIRRHPEPWNDPEFLTMLKAYEEELHAIDSCYPLDSSLVYLDVETVHTYVAEDDGEYLGFVVFEQDSPSCEIHDLYTCPKARNGRVVIMLLDILPKDTTIISNIFYSNERSMRYFRHLIARLGLTPKVTGGECCGVPSKHYELIKRG